MTIKLDTARFDRDVRKLAKLTGKTVEQALDAQGRLFLGDCVRATPPFTPGKNWSEPFSVQRGVGTKATEGQVGAMFEPMKNLRVYDNEFPGKAGRMGRSIRKLIRENKFEEARKLLEKIGIRVFRIVRDATPQEHRQARDRRGRVQRPGKIKRMVVNAASIAKLIRRKVMHVGLAKSGWRKAAEALGLKLPGWIRKHTGQGLFQRTGKEGSPVIVLGNAVPYIQASGQELGIMQWAWRNRLRNLPKQVEATLKAQLKQYTRKTSVGRF